MPVEAVREGRPQSKIGDEIMTGSVLLHSRKVQTEALNETLNVLGEAPADSADHAQEVRWLMEDCVRTAGRLKAAFDEGQKRWPATPVEDIHEFYTEFLGVVDGQLQLAGRLRERARQSSENGGEAFDLKPLDESIETLRKLKEAVTGLCEWLISPDAAVGRAATDARGNGGRPLREGSTSPRKTSSIECGRVGRSSRNDPMELAYDRPAAPERRPPRLRVVARCDWSWF